MAYRCGFQASNSRLLYVSHPKHTSSRLTSITDSQKTAYDIRFVYSQVEVCLAIATASAPALRPVVARWFPGLFSTTGKSGKPGYYGDNNGPYAKYGGRSAAGASGKRGGQGGTVGSTSGGMHVGRGAFPLKDLGSRRDRTELRTQSPTSSEEEIMTYHGIMRKTDITIKIEKEDGFGSDGRGVDDRSVPIGHAV